MPDYRVGAKMAAAEAYSQAKHRKSLKAYLRDKTNRGVSDIELSQEFGVSRHTICNWKRLLGIVVVKRALTVTKTITEET